MLGTKGTGRVECAKERVPRGGMMVARTQETGSRESNMVQVRLNGKKE